MWKTKTEAEIWFDNVILWYKELCRRKLAMNDMTPLDDYIEIESDNGICEVGILESETSILSFELGRAGAYTDENRLPLTVDRLLGILDKRPVIKIRIDEEEIVKYNDTMVLPYTCESLEIVNRKNVLTENTNVSLVLQSSNVYLNKFKLKYIKDIIMLGEQNYSLSMYEKGGISKSFINKLYMIGNQYLINSCYIKELVVNADDLIYNYDNCIIDKAKIIHIDTLESFIHEQSGSKLLAKVVNRLQYMHKLNNDKGKSLVLSPFVLNKEIDKLKLMEKNNDNLTSDTLVIYLSDEEDDSGYYNYFEIMEEEYIEGLSESMRISINSIEVVNEDKKLLKFKHYSGITVYIYLCKIGKKDIYDRLNDVELKKYE